MQHTCRSALPPRCNAAAPPVPRAPYLRTLSPHVSHPAPPHSPPPSTSEPFPPSPLLSHSLPPLVTPQDHRTRLGCGPAGPQEIFDHPYWRGIEWDLVPLKKFDSPCRGLKGPRKQKKEGEKKAEQIAADISEAEAEGGDSEYAVGNWDFVSPSAIIEEYMENIYLCVSSI